MHKMTKNLEDLKSYKAVWVYSWNMDRANYDIQVLRDNRLETDLPLKVDTEDTHQPGVFSTKQEPGRVVDHGVSKERAAQLRGMFDNLFYFGLTP